MDPPEIIATRFRDCAISSPRIKSEESRRRGRDRGAASATAGIKTLRRRSGGENRNLPTHPPAPPSRIEDRSRFRRTGAFVFLSRPFAGSNDSGERWGRWRCSCCISALSVRARAYTKAFVAGQSSEREIDVVARSYALATLPVFVPSTRCGWQSTFPPHGEIYSRFPLVSRTRAQASRRVSRYRAIKVSACSRWIFRRLRGIAGSVGKSGEFAIAGINACNRVTGNISRSRFERQVIS